MKREKYPLIIFCLISVFASCSLREKTEKIASYLEGSSEEVNYAHAKWGTKVKVYPSSSPGHPESAINDGEINTIRGWRELDNVRWNIANCFINVYPDLVGNRDFYRRRWTRHQKLHATYVQLQFPSPRPLRKVVIYTIDSAQYPAKEYGIRAYQLYYQDKSGNWQLIKEEDSNIKGRIECTFPMIRTKELKLVILETNDVARLREDETWPLRVTAKKLRRAYGLSFSRGIYPIPFNNLWPLLHQLPCPLKHISKVIEIEAYGPAGKEKPMDIPPVLNPKRYTGKWESYTTDTADGIENDYVWVMQADKDDVWFGTKGGLLCYDKKSDKWTTYHIPNKAEEAQAISVLIVHENQVWVGTFPQLYTFADMFFISKEKIANAPEGVEATLKFRPEFALPQKGGGAAGVYTFDKTNKSWKTIKEGFIGIDAISISGDKIDIGTWDSHCSFSYDTKNSKYIDYKTRIKEEAWTWEEWWKWVKERGGYSYRSVRMYQQKVPDSFISRLPEDLMIFDNIIRAPIGFRAHLYDPSGYSWNASWPDKFQGLSLNAVDELNRRWRSGPPNYRRYLESDGLSNRYVNDIARDGDYVWVATADGVSRLDLLTDTWERFNVEDGLPHRFATCVVVDDDSVWVGTRRGIARYRKIFVQNE